jgi:hypothetical protein
MTQDIRDKAHITPEEIDGLNFIRRPGGRIFRKHFRSGLRSHIAEILDAGDLLLESRGVMTNGVRRFPQARPGRILRIFRKRFSCLDQVMEDIAKYRLLLGFLGPDRIARSEEFVVDYVRDGQHQILLCGLQEYVDGEILDPWGLYGPGYLTDLLDRMPDPGGRGGDRVSRTIRGIDAFVHRTRRMIAVSGCIPDLAGIGNLLLTPEGDLKLVDINNILTISPGEAIPIDDKGYPSCDKSIETMAILETRVLGRSISDDDPFYGKFLAPERKTAVLGLEKAFYESLKSCPG